MINNFAGALGRYRPRVLGSSSRSWFSIRDRETGKALQITGPPAPETLQKNQAARRQRIIRTALRALSGSEYEQIKISDVARDSGVALGTLYRYFASKEHLFAAVFVEWQKALKTKLEKSTPAGETEADRLREIFYRSIRAFQVQPQFFRVLMMMETTTDTYAAEVYSNAMGSQYTQTLQRAFDGPIDANRKAIIMTIESVLVTRLRSWVMNRSSIKDVFESVDDAIRLIYQGHES